MGLHAVACEATGAVSRGHTTVKLVHADIYRAAGARVYVEQHPEGHPERRPADLLVSGILPKPMSIDETIWSRYADGPDPLDAVVSRKVAAGKAICQLEGWIYRVFGADVYGAMHPLARTLMTKLAGIIKSKCGDVLPNARQQVWRSVSAAILSRAAGQLARHADRLRELPPDVRGTLGIQDEALSAEPDAANDGGSSVGSDDAVDCEQLADDNLNALALMVEDEDPIDQLRHHECSSNSVRAELPVENNTADDPAMPTSNLGIRIRVRPADQPDASAPATSQVIAWEDKELGARVWVPSDQGPSPIIPD